MPGIIDSNVPVFLIASSLNTWGIWVSSVRIVSRLRDERPWFDFRKGKGFYIFATASKPVLGPIQPPVQGVHWAPPLGGRIKRPGHKADHLLPSSAEIRNEWSYTSTPPYIFIAWYLVNNRNSSDFTFKIWILGAATATVIMVDVPVHSTFLRISIGDVQMKFYVSTSDYLERNCQLHAPAALIPRKEPLPLRYQAYRKLSCPQRHLYPWRESNCVYSACSQSTDWARPHYLAVSTESNTGRIQWFCGTPFGNHWRIWNTVYLVTEPCQLSSPQKSERSRPFGAPSLVAEV
jgi:hypothetical protein